MIEEDKVTLARMRVELVDSLQSPLPTEERVRVQAELSVVNAKIKALNTTEAARLKAAADRRKAKGLSEAQANAARARAKIQTEGDAADDTADEDDDPGQTAAIDGWIDMVLLRHDVDFKRSPNGALMLAVPQRWNMVLDVLIAGIYAASRGQELPDLPSLPPRDAKDPKKAKKR